MTDTQVSETAAPSSLSLIEPEDRVQQSYFGFEQHHKVFLSDGISFIEHKTLNEGDRRMYQNETNREVTFKRGTGDASMKMKPGDEKHLLLVNAIVGWNLVAPDLSPVAFSRGALERWLSTADPSVVDTVELDIRRKNPWLMADISIEEIDRQIEQLQEMRVTKVKEEEGKVS